MNNDEILLKTAEKEIKILKENLANIKDVETEKINRLTIENEKLKNENNEIKEQLDSILRSRSYKFIQKLKKLIRK